MKSIEAHEFIQPWTGNNIGVERLTPQPATAPWETALTQCGAGAVFLKILRILLGVCLILLGKEGMEGGLSKYAPEGNAQPKHWILLFVCLLILFGGATVIRPYWWRELRRRH